MSKQSQITKLINIYLDGLVSIGNDAGWEGDSFLARVIQFAGVPPKGTGMDQSNQAMINAMDRFKAKHKDFPLINGIVTRLVSKPATRRHILALLIALYYHGINERAKCKEFPQGKPYTPEDHISIWAEHCNRAPWEDLELLRLVRGGDKAEALRQFEYGKWRAAPRLIRRELMLQ